MEIKFPVVLRNIQGDRTVHIVHFPSTFLLLDVTVFVFSVPAAPACADDVEVDAKDDNKKRKSDSQVPTSETKKKKSS